MIVSAIPAAVFAKDDPSDGWRPVSVSRTAGMGVASFDKDAIDNAKQESLFDEGDTVRVSIVLSGASTVERFSSDAITDRAAVRYRSRLKAHQDQVADRISDEALDGEELDVVWNLTLAANMISAYVEYGRIDEIESLTEVESVLIEACYAPQEVEATGETAEPQMTLATGMTMTEQIWADGYTGAGSSVAVIDTGLDTEHISFDEGAFDYAIGALGEEVDLITKDEVASVLDNLNAKQYSPELTADDVYRTSKMPFAYNYVDRSTDVTHLNDTQGEHGSHVAGISTANRYVPDGTGGYAEALSTVLTQGQAPDAQLLVMKVFGAEGGAYDSDYFAAIEDAIYLGADVANLSLGTSNPGFSTSEEYADKLDALASSNTVVAISAGNEGYWSENTFGELNYAEDKSLDTVGDPGSLANSLCVASVDNAGVIASVILFGDKVIQYTAGDGTDPLVSLADEYEFVALDSIGTEEEFAALADVLPGRIAVCWRGTTTFVSKANAAIKYGASALVICNNSDEKISMLLSDYEYTAPVVMINRLDGIALFDAAQPVTDGEGDVLYYTGTFTIPDGVDVYPDESNYCKMSDFSSWGIPGSLIMKPEVTAPGGQIYSVFGENLTDKGTIDAEGNDKYKLMSGTSMASPQIAGISALLAEYIRENDLERKTGMTQRHLITSLIMGTAIPIVEEESDCCYSILKQGAGLVNTAAAYNTHTFITMHSDATASYRDGKVKAELGEISRDDKSFSFTFDVNNFGDEASDYFLDADFFTQDCIGGPEYDVTAEEKLDENGDPVITGYMALTTAPLAADVVWTVDGEVLTAQDADGCDFNGDGFVSYSDVRALLDYVVGKVDDLNDIGNADIDGDGDTDTYDAKQFLDLLDRTKVTVPAGEAATVNVSVTLLDVDDYDANGAYVEGFVFVKEAAHGGADGVTSSIPVLGYYGGWSEFTMFDHASAINDKYGIEDRTPYLAYQFGRAANRSNYFSIRYGDQGAYIAWGNLLVQDETYMPERNAISPDSTIYNVRYSLIRNAAASEVVITDESGREIFKKSCGKLLSAFYDTSDKKWNFTSGNKLIGFTPSELEEGSRFTVTFRTAPEYYTMKGEVDWDALSENTRLSQTFTVDATAPEILSAEAHYDELGQVDAVKITVYDEQYVAAAYIGDENTDVIDIEGSDPDPDAAPGATREIVFDLTEAFDDLSEVPEHLFMEAYDYALNSSAYYLNLNEEENAKEPYVDIERDALTLPLASAYEIEASVEPWGKNCDVIWTSADDTIASVDEDGVVTGVGVGQTTLTATSEDDPGVYAEMTVDVVSLGKGYSAVLWDEKANKWFISFDTETIPLCTLDFDEALPCDIASICCGTDGVLYGVTFNEEEDTSELYIIDEDTYELTYVGESYYATSDIAASPAYSAWYGSECLTGAFSNVMLRFDAEDFSIVGELDLSDYIGRGDVVGIAFVSSDVDETSGTYVDTYYLLDATGHLYLAELAVIPDGDGAEQEVVSFEDLGQFWDAFDISYFHSLYLDTDGYLVCTVTCTNTGYANVYLCDVSDTDDILIYDFGSFGYGTWPIGGIYEKDASPALAYSGLYTPDAGTNSAASVDADDLPALTEKADAPAGALNAVTEGEGDTAPAARRLDPNAVALEITAKDETFNGLYNVSFDPDVYEFTGAFSAADFFSCNAADGSVTIGVVDREGFAEGETVATVGLCKIADGAETVVVTTEEANDEHPATEEYFFAPHTHGYLYAGCEWKDIDGAYTAVYTYACECGDEITENIVPEVSRSKGVATYVAEDENGNRAETAIEEIYTVTLNGQPVAGTYKWGDTCTLSTDGRSKWNIGGKVVAEGTNKYTFAVTDNTSVTVEESELEEAKPIVVTTLTSPKSGKAVFNAKWSIPAGSEVNSVKIYRGTTKADKTISAETLISAGTATKVNLYARNGDYTLNISGLTATKYQHVVIVIDYTLKGERKTLTSEVQKILPNGVN